MDVAYVNPFITSTIETFTTMMNVEVSPGKPRVKQEPLPTYDISGIIGLSGDAQGSIAVSFPKVVALRVVSKMLGMELKVVGPELTDGIGELANIIAGNAKQHLDSFSLSISLPNVIVGKDHVITNQSGIPSLMIPFSGGMGDFCMEVSLKTK